jgi:hypothetical protein
MTKNELIISVSPIIYNNGNRKIALKTYKKEVLKMQEELIINNELKNIILSDKDMEVYFTTYLLFNIYKQEDIKEYELFTYNNYLLFKNVIYEIKANDETSLKSSLIEIYNDLLSNDLINDVIQAFIDLYLNEGKKLINTISRLLYLQDKHKNDEIGQEIDKKIKEWINFINEWDKKNIIDINIDDEISLNKFLSQLFYKLIPNINYDIATYKNVKDYMDLFNYKFTDQNILKETIKNVLENRLNDSLFIDKLNFRINEYLDMVQDSETFDKFLDDKEDTINSIKKKYNAKGIKQEKEFVKEINKKSFNENLIKDIINENISNNPYIDELYNLYDDYINENNLIYDDTEDKEKWTKKADIFINNLSDKKKPQIDEFNINYTIKELAYNKDQKNTYIINEQPKNNETTEKKPRLSKDELKEKYKEITLLNDDILDEDYNRKFARLDTSKVTSNIRDLRESITKRTQSNTDLTIKQIKELEKIPKPSKDQLAKLKELKIRLKEQQEEQKIILNEANNLKDDIALINKQIIMETDAKSIKSLTRKRNKMQKDLREKEIILNNEGINLQSDLFSNKFVVAEINNDKESYKLMIDRDYDITNFNMEGRNFLYYIPNIPNIMEQLNGDFIPIDIKDYMDFTGRPNGNISRTRKNLQNTLKEMRKESYDYTYKDEKGVLHDDSLVLIADIKGTEHKGLASIQVQLGATFKDELKKAFKKSQYIKVNSDVFKIGQGKNNKVENMAKEIFLYLAKMCRTEAKSQVNSGEWTKTIHLDTIITKLSELNLIKYDLNRYNECVKEPLLYALNIGMELGYFKYKTKAFDYYDNVIASNNNGANVKDKIDNFERGKAYGIKFTINGDMVDLQKNTKANKTYNKYKNKYKNKDTN